VGVLVAAALLLSLERACYLWTYYRPDDFRARWAGLDLDPVGAMRVLFAAFKAIQIGVFVWWCYVFGGGTVWPTAPSPVVTAGAVALVGAGQALNAAVFYRMGATTVLYGASFGREVRWSRAFPYSWLDHPQYVGVVMSIWGFFLFMRFPHADWAVLPAVETFYYVAAARWER